jgi:hypothetical protein
VSRHAVGNAPLAGLRVKQMVTTNFDPCLELALETVLKGEFRRTRSGAEPAADEPSVVRRLLTYGCELP